MEPNQTNPSPENSGIPQGIPTGVSVPNNQPSAQNTVQQPTAPTTIGEPAPAAPTAQTPVPAKEGPLDRFFK